MFFIFIKHIIYQILTQDVCELESNLCHNPHVMSCQQIDLCLGSTICVKISSCLHFISNFNDIDLVFYPKFLKDGNTSKTLSLIILCKEEYTKE